MRAAYFLSASFLVKAKSKDDRPPRDEALRYQSLERNHRANEAALVVRAASAPNALSYNIR